MSSLHRTTPKIDTASFGPSLPGFPPIAPSPQEARSAASLDGSVCVPAFSSGVKKVPGRQLCSLRADDVRRVPPALFGCLLGSMLLIVFILGAVRPPDHNLVVRANTLRIEQQQTSQRNQELEILIHELRARLVAAEGGEGKGEGEGSFLRRLDPLADLKQKGTGNHSRIAVGSVVHAASPQHVGKSLIVRKGAPGLVVGQYSQDWAGTAKHEMGEDQREKEEEEEKRKRWVVQFIGAFGPKRPVRMSVFEEELVQDVW